MSNLLPAPVSRGNLFAPRPAPPSGEIFDPLLSGGRFRLERIVSTGQSTPPGEWYDQETDEWVVLLSGSATLRLETPDENLDLVPGDWVLLPARRRHRVERTSEAGETVWLALHFQA